MMTNLAPGDVLSYSAGSTQTGPEGFRKVKARGNLMAEVGRRWPDVIAALGHNTVLVINAYPASLGTVATGITIDTYLSTRVLTRALKLGAAGGHPVVLLGQPLFLADALLRHIAAGHPLPDTLMLWTGGYAMQGSLERALTALLEPHVRKLGIVQFFGAAEVDAGCMMGRERNARGELVYHARTDVEPETDGDSLLLTLRDPDGRAVVERFATGDCARPSRDGWVLWNHRRYHPLVRCELESWTDADWQRRTGYVRRVDNTIWIQLREGEKPAHGTELEFYEFARCFGFSWLDKPYWR